MGSSQNPQAGVWLPCLEGPEVLWVEEYCGCCLEQETKPKSPSKWYGSNSERDDEGMGQGAEQWRERNMFGYFKGRQLTRFAGGFDHE